MYSDLPERSHHVHKPVPVNVSFSKGFILLVVLTWLLPVSCDRGVVIQREGLYGRWDIHKAVRNGTETPYLRRGYFIIEPNGSMTVNITGEEEKGAFVLDDNKLRLKNEKDFYVEFLRRDSMSIRYDMNSDNTFLFYLTKQKHEDH